MREIIVSSRFKKDLKRAKRRGLNLEDISEIIDLLAQDAELPKACRPHKLKGNFSGYWECHIHPDWLLVYDLDDDELLVLVATGTHSDLFS